MDIGIADDAVDLARSGDHLSANTVERTSSLKDEIKRGTIVVPDAPAAPPTIFPADADHVIGATLNGDQCLVAPPDTVRLGNIIRVDFDNKADGARSVGLFLGEFPADTVSAGGSPLFGLPAQPGGRNAGVIRLQDAVTYSIACIDPTTFGRIGAGAHFTVVES